VLQTHIVGSILGTAVGDSIGLPYEGLSRQRARKILGQPERHRLFFGRGMISDDTEHTCMVAQALIDSGGDVRAFARLLAWRLRFWIIALPAGIGMATLRSILRLWIGFSPEHSGVFSAGNGAAMRAAVIGAAVDDPSLLRQLVRACARITHTDPKAEQGAYAVALAAQMIRHDARIDGRRYLAELSSSLGDAADEFLASIVAAVDSVERGQNTESFAADLGLAKGVSGYSLHSIPVAIHAWLANQNDLRGAVTAVVRCGGDTDSTGAIVGGIVGTAVGKEGIPREWLQGILEWPQSVAWMERLALQLAASCESGDRGRAIRLPIYAVLLRNLFFLLVVLFHGFRRLLPPY